MSHTCIRRYVKKICNRARDGIIVRPSGPAPIIAAHREISGVLACIGRSHETKLSGWLASLSHLASLLQRHGFRL
jgi:hypothetical protein